MLIKIRDKASGWIAYVIVALISIPFALWGIQQYFGLDPSPTVIEVGDREITEAQLEQAILNRQRELEESQINYNYTEAELRDAVTSRLISEQLLALAVEKYYIQTTDRELARFIRSRPEFQNPNTYRFDANVYEDTLARSGFSVANFEQSQREALKKEHFVSMIQQSSFILPSERKQYVRLSEQQRKVRYLPVSYGYFVEPDSITTEEAEKHYEEHKTLYQSPYKARFEYIDIDIARITEKQQASNEEITAFYERYADNYLYPEKFNLRHILISTDDLSDDEALSEADDLHLQLSEGADFAELARDHSDDRLTAQNGGELPELTAAELDNDSVRNAVLQLAEGEFTAPILTPYGVQIFQLAQLKAATQKPLEEVQEEITDDIRTQKAKNRYTDLVESLDLLLFENQIGFFRDAQEVYEQRLELSQFLDISKEEDILAIPQVKEAVIAELIEGGNSISGLIEIEPGRRTMIVGILDTQPSKQLPFAGALQDIITRLTLEKAHQKAKENNETWLAALRSGNLDMDTIAQDNQLTIEEVGYIDRNASSIPRPIVEKAFAIPSATALPIYQTLRLNENYNNEHIVMELLDIQDGIENSQTFVVYSLQNREAVAVLNSLRDFHEVKINLNTEENE